MEIEKLIRAGLSAAKERINFGLTMFFADYFERFIRRQRMQIPFSAGFYVYKIQKYTGGDTAFYGEISFPIICCSRK